jgi:hypothetical protein
MLSITSWMVDALLKNVLYFIQYVTLDYNYIEEQSL